MASVTSESVLIRVLAEYQQRLDAALARIRELEGLTPAPSDTGASTPTEG